MDVPAHVVNPPAIVQGVQVRGGTNYDLSRSAVPTPLTRVIVVEPPPPPPPVYVPFNHARTPYTESDKMPGGAPVATLSYPVDVQRVQSTKTIAAIAKDAKKMGGSVIVAGHADSEDEDDVEVLAQGRAAAVAKEFRRYGVKPTIRSFAADRELTDDSEFRARNRRVEVFVTGSGRK